MRLYNALYKVSVAGTRTIGRIPGRGQYDRATCDDRRKWVEETTGADLTHLGGWWEKKDVEPSILKGNIENAIGMARIPVGVSGPLLFKGDKAQGSFLLPMVTTEGDMVASTTRGATCLTEAGGVETYTGPQTMTRVPLFVCNNLMDAWKLGQWIENSIDDIRAVIAQHSNHANLMYIRSIYDEDACHAAFYFETGDAAGQNMVTVTSMGAVRWIRDNSPVPIRHAWVTASMSGDKSPSQLNLALGRGMSVSAKAVVPEAVLNKVLNTTGEKICEWTNWAQRANIRIGSPLNYNFSKVLGGVFTSTGQDYACVGDSQIGITNVLKNLAPEGGVIISNHFSTLAIGTVGGGTGLPSQKACMDILDCAGPGKVRKLAEIIAGYCLALDLATISEVTVDEISEVRPGQSQTEHK